MTETQRAKGLQRPPAKAGARNAKARLLSVPVWVRWTGGVFGAVLVAIFLALYFLDWNALRGPIARYASHRLGREVRIDGNLHVKLFSWQPRIDVEGLWIGNPKWLSGPPAADVKHLAVELRLLPLLRGRWILPLVEIDHPSIDVVRESDGWTNWQFSNGSNGTNIPPMRHFVLNDGHLTIDDRERNLTFAGTVSTQETGGANPSHAFQLLGHGTLNGKDFSADVRGGPLIHVDESRPYRFTADVEEGATRAVVDGAISKPFHLGEYSATATVSGRNLADLYDLTGLALPGTPAYRISGALTRDGALYRFSNFSGIVGSSDLRGSLSVDTSGKFPFLKGKVSSRTLDFADLGPVVGNTDRSAVSGLLPDTPLRIDRLRRTNAEVDYKADAIRSRDFPLRGLATHISLENSVLLLKPLAFDFSRGKLAGFVRLDARRPVTVTSLDARLTGARIEQFIQNRDKPAYGLLEARAVLSGSGNSVRTAAATADGALTVVVPEGGVRRSLAEWLGVNVLNGLGLSLTGDTSDAALRCAVVHFGARNGVLTARQMVFDTEPVLITGQGSIDMRNDTLDLTVQGKPKHFQFLHLNVPVTVHGPLTHPTIGVKAGQVVAQAGIAAVLGFLFPPAAILPFVDPDLAKNANCTGLVSEAAVQSAPVKTARRKRS